MKVKHNLKIERSAPSKMRRLQAQIGLPLNMLLVIAFDRSHMRPNIKSTSLAAAPGWRSMIDRSRKAKR